MGRNDEVAEANGAEAAASAVDELSQDEIFEEKLREAMDLATEKSAQTRTMALESMCTAFLKKYLPDFVEDRRVTITDIVEKAVKRGKPAEQIAASRLAVIALLQLGGSEASEDFVKDLKPAMITLMLDPAASCKSRAAAASAVGDLNFLATAPEDFDDILNNLEKLFTARSGANAPEDLYNMMTAALSAWTLLYTLLPDSRCLKGLEDKMEVFERLLESGNVDLRIAAGEAIVVLYESAYELNCEIADELAALVYDRLHELAKDSHKYRYYQHFNVMIFVCLQHSCHFAGQRRTERSKSPALETS